MRHFLFNKLALSFSVGIILGWFGTVIVGVFNKSSIHTIAVVLICIVGLVLGTSSLAIAVSTFFPKFDWEHPKRMLSGSGNLVLNIAVLSYFGISMGIFALTWIIAGVFESSFLSAGIVGDIFVFINAVIISFVSILIAQHRLEKLEWVF